MWAFDVIGLLDANYSQTTLPLLRSRILQDLDALRPLIFYIGLQDDHGFYFLGFLSLKNQPLTFRTSNETGRFGMVTSFLLSEMRPKLFSEMRNILRLARKELIPLPEIFSPAFRNSSSVKGALRDT